MSISFYFSFIEKFKEELQLFCTSEKAFSRKRKIDLQDLVGLILSLISERNSNGYEISAQKYWDKKQLLLGKCMPGGPPNRSAITQAREKLHWDVFAYLLECLNHETQKLSEQVKWNNHSVYAVDGTWIDLPHQSVFLDQFPSRTTPENRGHYPKGKLVVAHNVFTGIPKTACLGEEIMSERSALFELSSQLERESILLLDRGYDGFNVMKTLQQCQLNFIVRQRAGGGGERLEVREFINSGKKDAVIRFRENDEELTIRLIRAGVDRKNRPIVIATSLLEKKYTRQAIKNLYFKRWNIETLYYQMKRLLKLENFHAKKMNGVLQEIWASLFYIGLTSANLLECQLRIKTHKLRRLNFKNATELLKTNLMFFIFKISQKTADLATEALQKSLSRSYHTYQPGRKNERICKRRHINWTGGRKNRAIDRIYAKISKNSRFAS